MPVSFCYNNDAVYDCVRPFVQLQLLNQLIYDIDFLACLGVTTVARRGLKIKVIDSYVKVNDIELGLMRMATRSV